MSTLVVDLGGGSIKIGFAGTPEPSMIDNCVFKSKTLSGRTFVGNEIENCSNSSSLFCIMPFKKGYLNNWEIQSKILDAALKKTFEKAESVQRLSRYCLCIDSGYSFTHLVPMADGRVMRDFVLRLTVGGKILTNRLVETVSYRHLDVRSEIYIMNQCKEDVCYVSKDFSRDLETTKSNPKRNAIMREYVLPDYAQVHRGYVRDPNTAADSSDASAGGAKRGLGQAQNGYVLRLNNERFTVPELLFHPGDVGYREMGLTEAMDYLMCERLPPAVRPGAWANCLVTGGNACLPGFLDRLKTELRCLPPDDLAVNLFQPNNPQTYAWQGGSLLAERKEDFSQYLVTRAEYEEHGSSYCERRFPTS